MTALLNVHDVGKDKFTDHNVMRYALTDDSYFKLSLQVANCIHTHKNSTGFLNTRARAGYPDPGGFVEPPPPN